MILTSAKVCDQFQSANSQWLRNHSASIGVILLFSFSEFLWFCFLLSVGLCYFDFYFQWVCLILTSAKVCGQFQSANSNSCTKTLLLHINAQTIVEIEITQIYHNCWYLNALTMIVDIKPSWYRTHHSWNIVDMKPHKFTLPKKQRQVPMHSVVLIKIIFAS